MGTLQTELQYLDTHQGCVSFIKIKIIIESTLKEVRKTF